MSSQRRRIPGWAIGALAVASIVAASSAGAASNPAIGGGIVGVDLPPFGGGGCAAAVSDAGHVLGLVEPPAGPTQVLYAWTPGEGYVDVAPGLNATFVGADRDRMLFAHASGFGSWSPSTGTVLAGPPAGLVVRAMAGRFVGGYRIINGDYHASIWDLDQGDWVAIPVARSLNRWVDALNSSGQAAMHGLTSTGRFRAYVWNPDGSIDALGSAFGAAVNIVPVDINERGSVVGTVTPATSTGTSKAFRWSKATGMVAVDPGGREPTAVAINEHGAIVGTMITPDGTRLGYRWSQRDGFTLIPEMSSIRSITNHDQILSGESPPRLLWDPVAGTRPTQLERLDDAGRGVGCSSTAPGTLWSIESNVRVDWSESDLNRLAELRAFYGYADNESLAKFGVYVLAFINAIDPVTNPTPVVIGEPGGAGSSVVSWTPDEIGLLNAATWRWQLDDEDAHRWGFLVLSFIAQLQGA